MSYQLVNPNSTQALWQKSGIGDYEDSGDWTWMFNPPPYDFLNPCDSQVQPAFGPSGLGCGCGCSGGCQQGLGQGLFNTGLFQSTNPLQWGWGEWVTVALGLYVAGSIISDSGSAAQSVKRAAKKHRGKVSFGGGALTALAVAGVAYVGYQYISSQQPTPAGTVTTGATGVAAQ